MGLDMYLKKRVCVLPFDWEKNKDKAYKDSEPKKMEVRVKTIFGDESSKVDKFVCEYPQFGCVIDLPFMYWRKRNAIHKWFVDRFAGGEDDCRQMRCEGKDLLKLVDICKEILADHSKAANLLPTEDGFFFGPTEYDDWYFSGLEMTVKRLADVAPDEEFIYEASW